MLEQVLKWPADDLIDLVLVCWLDFEPAKVNLDADGCSRLLPVDEFGYSSSISIAEAVTFELLKRGLSGDRAAWWLVMAMPSDGYLAETRGMALHEAVVDGTMPPLMNFSEAEMLASYVAWELYKDLGSDLPIPREATLRQQLPVRSNYQGFTDRFYEVLIRDLLNYRDQMG